MRKPRPDSILDNLPKNQREALEHWLFDEQPALSYDAAKERLWQDFNVRCSVGSLHFFYRKTAQRRLIERIEENAAKANEVAEAFQRNPAPIPRAVVDLVTQLAFEEITERGSTGLDKDFIVKLTKLAVDSGLKAKKLELDERKMELLEAKAKQAEAAESALKDGALSDEERAQRMKQIFGIV